MAWIIAPIRRPQLLKPLRLAWTRCYAQNRGPPTRQQRLEEANLISESNIFLLDQAFGLFNESVTRVVDVGSAPGNWLQYARDTLLDIHKVEREKAHEKCTLIGVDILLGTPIPGTMTTQGNIYSQFTHDTVVELLREAAFRKLNPDSAKVGKDFENSYVLKEIKETQLELEIHDLGNALSGMSLAKKYNKSLAHLIGYKLYQADLIMSDLSLPFLQDRGYYANTTSKPFIRSSNNEALRLPLSNPQVASLDLADAALLLCCSALAKMGTFVVRLAHVDLADPELEIFETRLKRVFHYTHRWSPTGTTSLPNLKIQELFIIGVNKKDYVTDKYKVFDIRK